MCVSTKEMSFFGDLICRPSSSCPRRSPFSAKARFACGRFAGAPLELTLPRFFPSLVVSRSICFVRSKQARTTSSSAPRFAAKRSTSASFSQHESSAKSAFSALLLICQLGARWRTAFSHPGAACARALPWLADGAPSPSARNGRRGTCAQYKSSTSPVQVQYKTVLGGAARLDFPGFDLLRVLYVPFV